MLVDVFGVLGCWKMFSVFLGVGECFLDVLDVSEWYRFRDFSGLRVLGGCWRMFLGVGSVFERCRCFKC